MVLATVLDHYIDIPDIDVGYATLSRPSLGDEVL
jgi:hypothetical protein